MANINEILARAAALRDETALNSISPERAGGIMYDTLLALNELWLQQGAALVISKIYASVAAMEADTAPVSDLTGKPLRPGQIVVIASSDSDNGSVYRYNGTESPSWSLVGSIGNLDPVDSLDSDSTTLPLAAHQGKVLDGKISQLGQQVDAVVYDKILNRYGNVVESAGWAYDTNYRQYISGNNVEWRFSKNTANGNAAIVFYNSSNQVVEFWLASSSEGYTIIAANNIPSTAAYFRFSFKSADINDVYCKMGSTIYRPAGVINDLNYYKNEQSKIESYKKLYLMFDYGTNEIRINQKYSNLKDIQIVLAPFGVNGLVQMYGWGFIGNTEELVSKQLASISTTGTDWVSPYIIKLSGASGASDWTGGCHGSSGASGNPTAEMVDVKVYADDRLLTSSINSYVNTVKVVVTNDIKAGNALNSGYCLREEVTYLFKDGKIFVSVRSKALQDIDLQVYYGTAVTNYDSEIHYLGKSIQKNNFTAVSRFTERCNGFVCVNSNGEYLIARLDSVGLAKQECNYYAHAATTGKAYFCFVNQDVEPIHYNTGDEFYWSGSYQFSEKFDISEMNGLFEPEVDAIPVQDSPKLITSGAVWDADNNIEKKLDNTVSGKYLNRYDKPVEDADWSYSDYIPYTQGNQVEVRFSKGTTNANAAILFYNSNYQKVEFWLCNSATGNTFILAGNIPSTAVYLRYSFKTSDIDDVYCVIGNTKIKPGGVINDFNYYKLENADNLSYKKNNVFYGDAIANTDIAEGLKKRILSALKFVRIEGYTDKINLVFTEIKLVAYSAQIPLKFSATISKIDNGSLVNVCSLRYAVTDISNWQGIVNCAIDYLSDLDVINASMTVDLNALGTELFNITLATSVESDTFEKYGLSYDCIVPVRVETSMFTGNNVPIRYQVALKSMIIDNLDTTRNYKLKKFSYDRATGLLTIAFCTDENLLDILYQSVFDTSKAVGVKWVETARWKALIDFNIMNNSVKAIALNYQSIANSLDVCLLSGIRDSNLSAGEELTLTYNNEPLRVLDCGKNSGLFYLTSGRKLFVTRHITKQKYIANDPALTLIYEFDDTKTEAPGHVWEMIIGIYGVRELNTGKLLVNICIQTSTNEEFDNINRDSQDHKPTIGHGDVYSKFYILEADGSSALFLFDGSWQAAHYSDGWVKRGGGATFVWDFYEWDNYIFVSERCAQGLGGRAWMSNDYGSTWYLIFNAYGDNNWIYWNPPYPFTTPSGFDPEHDDFNRVVTSSGRPNFHIHGIAYDHWRNQVLIVSGDATHVEGSYTAVWVWRIPQTLTLWPEQTYEGGYSGTEVYPLGGTKADNPVKMLANTWTRVGLHQNETHMEGGNMQFVGVIPFKDYIAFTTDNNHLGGNGIIINTYPENIVSTNFKIVYPLSPDSEGAALTHCGGGYMFIENLCLVTLHRENSVNMPEDSDRRGAVLVSTDGNIWKRVFVDDTLDADRVTKIMWGATMVGKSNELYLRYKGFNLDDNVIRQMRIY